MQTVSLPTILKWFKNITTTDYMVGVRQYDWPPFPKRLWQRNYYEHVIRDEARLDRIRAYIDRNPFQWAEDPENPRKQNV